MKKLLLIAAIGIASLAAMPAKAQVSLSINIGSQPQWGPRGYDHVDYYYLPDVDSYYYVPTRQFVYLDGGNWIHARNLPSRYRNYDLYGGRKVVINSPNPWLRHNTYRTQYVRNNYYSRPRVINRGYSRGYDRGHYNGPGYGRPGYGGPKYNNHGRDNFRARGYENRGNDNGNHGGGNRGGGNNNHDRGGDHGNRGGRGGRG